MYQDIKMSICWAQPFRVWDFRSDAKPKEGRSLQPTGTVYGWQELDLAVFLVDWHGLRLHMQGSLPWLPTPSWTEVWTMHGDFGCFWSGSDSTWSSRECGKAELFSGFCHNGLLAQKKLWALRCSCRTNITVNHFDIWSPHLNLNESLQVQCAPESHSVLPSIALAADTSSPDMMIQYCLCSTSWLCWP